MQCQTAHDNGLGGTFFDCSALNTFNAMTASEAAASWNAAAAQSDLTPFCGFGCLGAQTGSACAVWCYTGVFQGHVHLNSIGSNCICPNSLQDPAWQ